MHTNTQTNLNCNLRRLHHSFNEMPFCRLFSDCIYYIYKQFIPYSSISIETKSTASWSMTVSWLIAHYNARLTLFECVHCTHTHTLLLGIRWHAVQSMYSNEKKIELISINVSTSTVLSSEKCFRCFWMCGTHSNNKLNLKKR